MTYKTIQTFLNLKHASKFLIILIILPLVLSSCSILNLNSQSGFQNTKTVENKKFDQTKEISYKSEGVEYTEMFKLVDNINLPFITYIPEENWTLESHERSIALKEKTYGKIEITFMDEGIEEKQAQYNFEKVIDNLELEKEKGEFAPWIIDFRAKQIKDKEAWYNIYAILGKYNEQYFYIHRDLNLEGAELFVPIESKIYEEWRWKDTGEPLRLPFKK